MASAQKWEIAGFVTIAVALHVSAAAVLLPERIAMGAALPAPPAPVSAGSGDMSELIEQWENPPETASEPEMTEPEEIAAPEIEQPTPDAAPDRAPEVPQAPAAPELSAARPNLPETPEPQPELVKPELPELQSFEPPEIKSELALDSSTRPDRKPARTKPEPKREVQRQAEPKREPAPQQQAAKPQPQRQPATQGGGAGGNSSVRAAGGGSAGMSAQQRASLLSQWAQQIKACFARKAGTVKPTGRGGQVTLHVTIGSNGVVQGLGLAGSSGDSAVDQAAVRVAQRIRRCPAAPAGLNLSSQTFKQPYTVPRR
ncbi:energy transducer TonB family protein [Paracoccus methylarcula]|uniref:TonB family protein n=1 Tax=Paracoccus methylarcula TaxID=72022 RepID=A0A3R7NWL2_9RHOB|nr:energy transducer TonB [Paracoccus methylarcula]RNF33676.1 TonB family protein [Paracoccus methylarcula]